MSRPVRIGLLILGMVAGAMVVGALMHSGGGAIAAAERVPRPAQVEDPGPAQRQEPSVRLEQDAIDRLLAAVQVDGPLSYKRLSLFTVSLRRDYSDFLPRTFDDAVQDGDLLVQEIGAGEVNAVRVKNNGATPVFILAGEIMTGSKQDRTAQRDVLIPGHSDWIKIPVYCLEEGRWIQLTPQFETKRSLTNPALRAQAYAGGEQHAIWSEVERAQDALGVSQSASKAFQQIYENEAVRRKLDEYVGNLRWPEDQRLVGLVAFRGGHVLGADLFGTPGLFAALRDKVVRSYVLAAEERGADQEEQASVHEAARFLARAWSDKCSRTALDTPGLGSFYRLRSRGYRTTGGALLYRDEAVHMSLFPSWDVGPVPVPVPEPIPVPRFQDSQ